MVSQFIPTQFIGKTDSILSGFMLFGHGRVQGFAGRWSGPQTDTIS